MKRRIVVGILAVLLATSAYAQTGPAPDWPCWRGPNGDGVSREAGWKPTALDKLRVSWIADVGVGWSGVIIKDNRLITVGNKANKTVVSCLRADTGETIWESPLNETKNVPQGTPATDGKSVFFLGEDGLIASLDFRSGKPQWLKNIAHDFGAVRPFYAFAGSPVIEGSLLILSANTSGMALKRDTGELAWTSARPPKDSYAGDSSTGVDYATPVVYESGSRRYALISSWEGLHSVDVTTGTVAWVYPWAETYDHTSGIVADPVVADGKMFVTQYHPRYLGGALFDIHTGAPRLLWSDATMCDQTGNHVILGGYVYACNGGQERNDASVRCIDLATGRVLWDERPEGGSRQAAVTLSAADGKLIILTDKGILAIAEANPGSYKEIARADLREVEKIGGDKFWTPPVLYGGRIYCRGSWGDLICVDVSK